MVCFEIIGRNDDSKEELKKNYKNKIKGEKDIRRNELKILDKSLRRLEYFFGIEVVHSRRVIFIS